MPTILNSTGVEFPDIGPTQLTSAVEWQSTQTGNFNAAAGKGYPVNTTSGAITATLPASPVAGQKIGFVDYAGTFATTNLTVNPNGNKINGQASNVTFSNNNESVILMYVDSTQGWLAMSAGYDVDAPFEQFYTVSYLSVAGGGAGGGRRGGGGGAGGIVQGTVSLSRRITYTITVGAGGTGFGAAPAAPPASIGGNSTISGTPITTITSAGGGGGGLSAPPGAPGTPGLSGGSGGGGGGTNGPANVGALGSGTPGQGNPGTAGVVQAGGGGGGGGATASPGPGPGIAGPGGNGLASSITGSSVTYAGGGGGGTNSPTVFAGTGGTGGGGNGGGAPGISAGGGGVNLGGGGGGAGGALTSGSGGSGVVILSMPTANYTGEYTGTVSVTTSGANTILSFTGSGTYTA